MNDFDNFTKKAKLVLFRIVEVLALTVAILLLLYLLLGEASGNYITSVAVNVSLFISAVTPEALAAVALGMRYTVISIKDKQLPKHRWSCVSPLT